MRPFRLLSLFWVALLPFSPLSAQPKTDTLAVFDEYMWPMPEPPYDLQAYIKEHTYHPEWLCGIQGRVVVKFIVTANGMIDSARVIKGIHPTLDSIGLNIIRKMPPWKPGVENGKAVAVPYTMPIRFRCE